MLDHGRSIGDLGADNQFRPVLKKTALGRSIKVLERAVKFRHTAALALVGWYLMLPPADDYLMPQAGAPLNKWHNSGDPDEPFSTLAECEAGKVILKQNNSEEFQHDNDLGSIGAMLLGFSEALDAAQCVKSDDPRLRVPPPTPANSKKLGLDSDRDPTSSR